MCAENSMVQGMVRNHPQISQRGACGSCAHAYQASAQIAANDSRFNSTNGDSGIASTRSGRPDQQRLQRTGNLAARPDHVGAEERPRRGGVVAESEQEDLGLVLEKELAGEPEE